jgi:hypothetical protein
MRSLLLPLLSLTALTYGAPTTNSTVVKASTGYYVGVINETYPNVRAFLSVPYGMSTAGANRWMPPKPVPASNNEFDATQYPAACPQYVTAVKNIWNQEIPQYLQYWGVSNLSAGVSAPFASEDCLKLAIWTPANATSSSKLPVAMVGYPLSSSAAYSSCKTDKHQTVLDWRRLSDQRHSRAGSAPSTLGQPLPESHRGDD